MASAPNLGLVGALVVAGRGELQPPAAAGAAPLPAGVDFLVPLYFQVCEGGCGRLAVSWVALLTGKESA